MEKIGRYSVGLALLSVATSLFAGCGVGDVVRTVQTVQRLQQAGQEEPDSSEEIQARLAAEDEYREILTPLKSGAGLVVCAPAGADAAFSIGSAYWLQFFAGGQGALGQTPMWHAIDDVWLELKKPDLRLSRADALKLAGKTGATHVAVGVLEPGALRYEIVRVSDKKSIARVGIAGDRTRLAAQLPQVARKMCTALGVASPRIPEQSESVANLTKLGTLPMKTRVALPQPQARQLETLAKTSAPAALLQLQALRVGKEENHYERETLLPEAKAVASRLMQLAPGNTHAFGTVGWFEAHALLRNPSLSQEIKKYPNNYLLQSALLCRVRVLPQNNTVYATAVSVSERAVRCAPRNPVAWQELGWSHGVIANATRSGRYWNKMTGREQALLVDLAPKRLAATRYATQLDPDNAYGWSMLSRAAKVAGDDASADEGLWKAIALEPDDPRWYEEGLDMYQPKWRGDPVQLQKLIDLIQERPRLLSQLYGDCMYALQYSNMKREMRTLNDNAYAIFTKQAAANPRDVEPLVGLGKVFSWSHQEDNMLAAYKAVVNLDPKHAVAQYQCGWTLHYSKKDYDAAEKHYRAAIAAAPRYSDAIDSLADLTYYVRHDAKKAEALYRRAISIQKNGLYYAQLARLLLDTGREPEARRMVQLAIQYNYSDPANPIWERLGIKPGQ